MSTVDLSQLSAEDKAKLMAQLEQEQAEKQERIDKEREQYKHIVNDAVLSNFDMLKQLSNSIQHVKRVVFNEFDAIIAMKEELFKVKEGQRSHTFSTLDGRISIKLGYRIRDNYDDTVTTGVAKVREYLSTLAKDKASAEMIDGINILLKSDKKGNLKPGRVLELKAWADKSGNLTFLDGVKIIENAYKPAISCQFIEVRYKDEKNREHSLPLSISAFDIEVDKEAKRA